MPVPFIMPKFEESVLTVETEKVAIDVPAPASGTLAGILYRAGVTPFQWTLGCLREEVARKMDDLMSWVYLEYPLRSRAHLKI